jgi:rubrerythrin
MKSTPDSVIEILKQAMLLELQGKAFYSKAAEQSETEGIRNIFSTMAKEEERHIHYLAKHYNSYKNNGVFSADIAYEASPEFADTVLSDQMKNSINAASYDAAAVSAAIEMEKKAVTLYQGRAKESEIDTERNLYDMLAKWELTHLDLLTELNDSIVESVWNENSFWPF